MNKKTFIPVGLVLIILCGAGILVARRGASVNEIQQSQTISSSTSVVSEDNSEPSAATATMPEPSTTPAQPPEVTGRFSGEGDIEGSDVQVFDIVYDGNTYSPGSLSIKNGDIILFKNKSKVAFQPASDPHPAHTDYPAFDAKQPIAAGKSYQFKFIKNGTWKFHDHLNPSAQGSVVVTP